jgi:hypothetical protein
VLLEIADERLSAAKKHHAHTEHSAARSSAPHDIPLQVFHRLFFLGVIGGEVGLVLLQIEFRPSLTRNLSMFTAC